MIQKREMITEMLDILAAMETFPEEPDEVARQFVGWVGNVASAFEAAGMVDELKAWNETAERMRFVADEFSFAVQMSSMKAILLGILEKLDQVEPVDDLFPMEIVKETRGYIEQIAAQANGCYQRGWYDASAVMIRRLIETLIIECFEQHGIGAKIKDQDDNYFYLRDLINSFLNETTWHIPRNMKTNLPKLKTIGDASAHNRYFVAKRSDIEKLSEEIRFTIQNLVYISGLQ